jgi:uncharacterized oligopeptide transporter (OPT) family protein
MREHLFNVHLPEQTPAEGFFKIDGKQLQAFGIESSGMLIAAGMIVGLRVSVSMLVASGLLYFVFTPWINHMDPTAIPLTGGGTIFRPAGWGLWGGTSVMLTASLMSLALQWKTIARSFKMLKGSAGGSSGGPIAEKMAAIEVPGAWMIAGMIPITLAMLAVQVVAFNIHWWAGVIAVALSFVLSLVACRATGETDTTPIGAMGKVMQLTFALISPGNVTHNLVSAGIAANSASSSADLLTDLKSGYLLGANPRKQFLAQFIGIFFGTLAIVPAWYLMVPDVEHLQKFPLPATNAWVAVAQLLSKGLESLPMSARWAILFGGLTGMIIPVLEKLFPKARPWLPSAMGLGLGWVVFFSNAVAFTIGAIIAWVWRLLAPKNQDRYNIPIASGLVAGESLMKAMLAMLATVMGLLSGGGKP